MVQAQQAYTTVLSGHIAALHPQVSQILCLTTNQAVESTHKVPQPSGSFP